MPGISTCCLMTEPLTAALDRLAPLTDLIEVMDEGPHFITDTGLFESYTQKFILHAPFHGMNIACALRAHPQGERAGDDRTVLSRRCSNRCAGVVIHPGYYAWEQEREAGGPAVQKVPAGTEACSPRALGHVLVREHGEHELLQPADTRRTFALIGETGLALDTGHAHLNGCLDEFLKTPFCHMHIHDNKGKSDTHSAIGEGTIDFKPVIRALERTGATAVLEMKDFSCG